MLTPSPQAATEAAATPSEETCQVASSLIPVQFIDNSILSQIANNKVLIDNNQSGYNADANSIACEFKDPYGVHTVTLRPTDAPATGTHSQMRVKPLTLPLQKPVEGDPKSFTDYEGMFGDADTTTYDGDIYMRKAVGGATVNNNWSGAGRRRRTAQSNNIEGGGASGTTPPYRPGVTQPPQEPKATSNPRQPAQTTDPGARREDEPSDADFPQTTARARSNAGWIAIAVLSTLLLALSAYRAKSSPGRQRRPRIAIAFLAVLLLATACIELSHRSIVHATTSPMRASMPMEGVTSLSMLANPTDDVSSRNLYMWLPTLVVSIVGFIVALLKIIFGDKKHRIRPSSVAFLMLLLVIVSSTQLAAQTPTENTKAPEKTTGANPLPTAQPPADPTPATTPGVDTIDGLAPGTPNGNDKPAWIAVLCLSIAGIVVVAVRASTTTDSGKRFTSLALVLPLSTTLLASAIALATMPTVPSALTTAAPPTPAAPLTPAAPPTPAAPLTPAPFTPAPNVSNTLRMLTWLPVSAMSAIGVMMCIIRFIVRSGATTPGSVELNTIPYILLSLTALSVVGIIQAFDDPAKPRSVLQPRSSMHSTGDLWSAVVVTHIALAVFGASRLQAYETKSTGLKRLADVVVLLAATASAAADAAAIRQATDSDAAGIASAFGIVLAMWWLPRLPVFGGGGRRLQGHTFAALTRERLSSRPLFLDSIFPDFKRIEVTKPDYIGGTAQIFKDLRRLGVTDEKEIEELGKYLWNAFIENNGEEFSMETLEKKNLRGTFLQSDGHLVAYIFIQHKDKIEQILAKNVFKKLMKLKRETYIQNLMQKLKNFLERRLDSPLKDFIALLFMEKALKFGLSANKNKNEINPLTESFLNDVERNDDGAYPELIRKLLEVLTSNEFINKVSLMAETNKNDSVINDIANLIDDEMLQYLQAAPPLGPGAAPAT